MKNKNLPEYFRCDCLKGNMVKYKIGLYHIYYRCDNPYCKDTKGLPHSKDNHEDNILE